MRTLDSGGMRGLHGQAGGKRWCGGRQGGGQAGSVPLTGRQKSRDGRCEAEASGRALPGRANLRRAGRVGGTHGAHLLSEKNLGYTGREGTRTVSVGTPMRRSVAESWEIFSAMEGSPSMDTNTVGGKPAGGGDGAGGMRARWARRAGLSHANEKEPCLGRKLARWHAVPPSMATPRSLPKLVVDPV